ncbi:hypothetical protein CR152_27770 [Massilia violaceinigra]|uniref:Uncharacterized protein n=1 Tax=Massilia violaceinigra TaxID=2045208 RepID=A0A2D2DSC8_9BURK|nr:hypothetical protein [Massilia violaceinigra]ATQ77876.1 hypothetical protein CR152_27770 [Massilia violaceinigra]
MTKPEQKIDCSAYIVHWAQWWQITEQHMLGATGAARADANNVHEDAKRKLRESVFLAARASEEAHHG